MTKYTQDIEGPGQAGAEIEVTPAMGVAGGQALRWAGLDLLDAEDEEVQVIANEIYRAMESCRLSGGPKDRK